MASRKQVTVVDLPRRTFLAASAAGLGVLALGWKPRPASALAATPAAKSLLDSLTQGKARNGRVTLHLPEIAENGNTVPMSVAVDSPMTEADHVKTITVVAEANPAPKVATIHLGPMAGKADIQLRIRLADTQIIHAIAEMSDGSRWMASREVKVTMGGCG